MGENNDKIKCKKKTNKTYLINKIMFFLFLLGFFFFLYFEWENTVCCEIAQKKNSK